MRNSLSYTLSFLLPLTYKPVKADDGHLPWFRYDRIKNEKLYTWYRFALQQLILPGRSPVLIAAKGEVNNII